jgi:signal transduction histidine kinase
MILDTARLLNEQIESYLYLRSIEDGNFRAPLDDLDLVEVLNAVLKNQELTARGMNVHPSLLVDGLPAEPVTTVVVRGIRSMLFGIFVNLVKNAIEASSFGSEVAVRVRSASPVTVSVHNQGVIPEEIRPRFFTKFVTTGKKRGTGIGAYGARMMAEALGCSITFTSDREHGTEIVVTFPETN